MSTTELLTAAWFVKGSVTVIGYLLLVASSGPVVSAVLENIGGEPRNRKRTDENPEASEGEGDEGKGDERRDDKVESDEREGNERKSDEVKDDKTPNRRDDERVSRRERDIGQVIGKCENVLVLSFVLTSAYTALAVVFAAKSIVRREDMAKNSKYYLAGTLVNFTYSILFALLVKQTVSVVS